MVPSRRRDLLLGPRRFTALSRSLGGITPTRLRDRLRRLEAADVVVREEAASGREVWYRLTAAGEELRPVVEALGAWGFRHAPEPPYPSEPVHPDHVMLATKVWLNRRRRKPRTSVVWAWRSGDEAYRLRFDGSAWGLGRGEGEGAALTVVAASGGVGAFSDRSRRCPPPSGRRDQDRGAGGGREGVRAAHEAALNS
jgi:DNA-binding HxlR family transcriptional regulator